MGGLLVFLPLPLLAILIWSRRGTDWRAAAVEAALGWGAGIALLTEILSAFHAFRFAAALVIWLGCNALLLGWVWRCRGALVLPRLVSTAEKILAAAIAGLLGLALLVALVAPPNTPDVLAYHLPRQLMWLQQGGVQHFVTNDERALMMPPLAEMIQAHALLLAGTDRWANLPQWFAFGLGLVVASLLARELGVSRSGQWAAAVLFATTPMAWHEATSAKNDLLVATWLGVLAWFALRMAAGTAVRTRDWILAGSAAGVALATKTTAWIFVPLPVLLLLRAGWRDYRRAWIMPVVILAIAGPHAWRNLKWYGTPLGRQSAETGGAQGVESLSLRGTLSTALRNATLHLALPSERWNEAAERAIIQAHRWFKQEPNDPQTTLWNLKYGVEWGPGHEAVAGAFLQFVLGVVALGTWLGRRRRGNATVDAAVFLAVGGVFLCCLLLKWQPGGARLQLPVFLLLAPIIVWAAGDNARRSASLAVLALIAWLPFSETQLRPWHTAPTIFATSRWEDYFRFHPVERQYAELALSELAAARPASVQVVSRHGFPYPLMKETRDRRLAEFWGVLPAAMVEPPAAILVTEIAGQKRPSVFTPPGAAEPFRLLPGLEPYALYLPSPRVSGPPPAAR